MTERKKDLIDLAFAAAISASIIALICFWGWYIPRIEKAIRRVETMDTDAKIERLEDLAGRNGTVNDE